MKLYYEISFLSGESIIQKLFYGDWEDAWKFAYDYGKLHNYQVIKIEEQ